MLINVFVNHILLAFETLSNIEFLYYYWKVMALIDLVFYFDVEGGHLFFKWYYSDLTFLHFISELFLYELIIMHKSF